jgi:hypothetical protein
MSGPRIERNVGIGLITLSIKVGYVIELLPVITKPLADCTR